MLGDRREKARKRTRTARAHLREPAALCLGPDLGHRRAITLWNTVYLDRVVRHLRSTGVDVSDDLLAHVAPLGWEHVGLTGDYLWSELDKPRERFRALRLSTVDRRA